MHSASKEQEGWKKNYSFFHAVEVLGEIQGEGLLSGQLQGRLFACDVVLLREDGWVSVNGWG